MSGEGYYNIGFKNVHTGEVQLLTTVWGDPAQFTEGEAQKEVQLLNSVAMVNGEFVAVIESD